MARAFFSARVQFARRINVVLNGPAINLRRATAINCSTRDPGPWRANVPRDDVVRSHVVETVVQRHSKWLFFVLFQSHMHYDTAVINQADKS